MTAKNNRPVGGCFCCYPAFRLYLLLLDDSVVADGLRVALRLELSVALRLELSAALLVGLRVED